MLRTGERAARHRSAACHATVVALLIATLGLLPPAAHATYLPLGESYAPHGIAIDPATGVIYSGDADGTGAVCRVLSVNATGIPQVVAGTGRCETSGDGGAAIDAGVDVPAHLAVDGSGNVYTASLYTLRRISASTGRITAWAGEAEYQCLLYGYGGPSASVEAVAAEVGMAIGGIAVDPNSGHLFVENHCNKGIWEIDESGVIVAGYAGVGTEHWATGQIAFAPEGDLYFVEGRYGETLYKLETRGAISHIAGNGGRSNTGDGGPATEAEFAEVAGLAVDSRGYVFLSTSARYIRGITTEGTIFAVAGRPWFEPVENPPSPGSTAESGTFANTGDLAIDPEDNLYVSDVGDKTLLSLEAPAEPRSSVSWILHERIESIVGERTGGGNPSVNACDQGCSGDPVNTASGEYWERRTDLALPGRGPALSFDRTYSAQSDVNGPFGHGWTANYLMSLEAEGPGEVVTITQENGSTIAFEPNGEGGYVGPSAYLATLRANEDGTWTLTRRQRDRFVFDREGRLVRELDLNGETTTLSYDEAGDLTTITDPSRRTFRLEYDEAGHVTQLDDSAGRTVRYGYEGDDLTSVVDARGETWRYAYDEQHRLTRRIDPNGHLDVENAYDSADRVTSQTDANEGVTRFDYEPGMTQVTSPGGRVRRDWYASGQLIQREDAVGTEDAGTWRYEYDPDTHGTTQVTDPDEHVWRATYDAAGRRTSTTDPLSHTTSATYDSLGDRITFRDERSVTTTFEYDEAGNLLSSSTPLTGTEESRVVRFTHGDEEHPGDVTAIVDPRGKTTELTYDAHGLLASVTDPLGDETTMSYDEAGNLEAVVSPRGNEAGGEAEAHTTSYVHDGAGLLTQATDPLGNVTRWAYDAAGNLESTTDPKEHVTSYGYDGADLLTSIERADETTLRRGYDADGNLTSATDGSGHATTYEYDARDRVASVTDPLERATTFGYDAAGNRTSTVDAEERTTTYGYDSANRLTSIRYSDEATPDVSFAYDSAGLRETMTDGSGTTSYTWDSLGRLMQDTDGASHTVRYAYDLAGNLTRLTYPSNQTVTRSYDDAGRLEGVTDWLEGTTSFEYDADSNLVGIAFPETSGNVDSFEYDDAGALAGASFKQGAETLASLGFTRDGNGLPTAIEQTGLPGSASARATYTALDQLASYGGEAYEYDGADNLTQLAGTRPLAYDAANELTEGPVAPGSAEAPAAFGYDSDGNRTTATPEGGSATRYGYDQADRLTSFAPPSGSSASYAYDGDGLRTAKTVGEVRSAFSWDLSSPLPLVLTDGTNRYVYGPAGLALEQIDESEAPTYLHHDDVGSTRLLTEARGAATATFTYSPYGSLTGSTGTQTTPLGFAGQYTDGESGLQYLRARYYDPATGQFVTRDPLASATGQPYGYAGGSPLAYTDPSGLFEWPSWSQIATRYVGAIDTLTGGATAEVREALDLNGGLDVCSADYRVAGDVMRVALGVETVVGTAGAVLEASPFEIAGMNRYARGGVDVVSLRDTRVLEGDNRIIGLDVHPIPTRAGRRMRPHLDIPPAGRKHWPYPDPRDLFGDR